MSKIATKVAENNEYIKLIFWVVLGDSTKYEITLLAAIQKTKHSIKY